MSRALSLDTTGVLDMHLDSTYVYLLNTTTLNNTATALSSQLYLYRHSIPSEFTPTHYIFKLAFPTTALLPVFSADASPRQLTNLVLVSSNHSNSTTAISVLSGFEPSDELRCETYPKPNIYQVTLSAYSTSCNDLLRSKQIIIAKNSSTQASSVS